MRQDQHYIIIFYDCKGLGITTFSQEHRKYAGGGGVRFIETLVLILIASIIATSAF